MPFGSLDLRILWNLSHTTCGASTGELKKQVTQKMREAHIPRTKQDTQTQGTKESKREREVKNKKQNNRKQMNNNKTQEQKTTLTSFRVLLP